MQSVKGLSQHYRAVKLIFFKYRGPSAVVRTDKNLRRQTKAEHSRLG